MFYLDAILSIAIFCPYNTVEIHVFRCLRVTRTDTGRTDFLRLRTKDCLTSFNLSAEVDRRPQQHCEFELVIPQFKLLDICWHFSIRYLKVSLHYFWWPSILLPRYTLNFPWFVNTSCFLDTHIAILYVKELSTRKRSFPTFFACFTCLSYK